MKEPAFLTSTSAASCSGCPFCVFCVGCAACGACGVSLAISVGVTISAAASQVYQWFG